MVKAFIEPICFTPYNSAHVDEPKTLANPFEIPIKPKNTNAVNGISKKIENSGGIILEGVCFYNMHAREIGAANGWKRLMSNSAKIINILGGYGYETILNSMEKCVVSACQGKIVK